MKILHTADLHLGSPLHGAPDRLRLAADGVLAQIVDLALDHRVDALVIAGDLLDRAVPDLTLRARLAVQLRRAVTGGVPVVLIKGNHDALMDYDGVNPLGAGIHLLTRAAPSVVIGDAVFHGIGFEGTLHKGSLLPDYPAPQPGRLNIGLMHTSLGGSPAHDPYAPVSPGDLLGHGYQYWALGHIHQRRVETGAGAALVMPGIPQGRDAGEPGQGSVTLATLGGMPDLQALPVARVVFETRALDLTGLDPGQVIDAFRAAAPPDGPHRMLRFEVSGSDLPASALEAYATEALEDHDTATLEALRLASRPPAPEGEALLALAAADLDSASFRDEAARLIAEWQAALPRELRPALAPEALDDLLPEAMAELALALRSNR